MERDKQEPIAIVGMACRLPGEVSSMGTLWDMISNERTGHGRIPADRWDTDVWHHPDPDRKGGIAVNHGYFLNQNIGHFDAPFFSTTAKEAAAMDPMKRLLLEVSYESIENAGIPVAALANSRTGCYVGCMTNDYEMLSLRDIYDLPQTAASATSEAMTANRVSWFFGLKGPSLTLDTACSSSLYALHLACQSLKLGEANMSLVGGVNLIMYPNTMHQLSAMHMLSHEGISHTFDDRANGYGRGEGISCIVIKRLSDALRDGDTVRAVIRGTGVNADGKTPSITQPSSLAQAELIKDTYEAAGLDMNDTQYFECHGTGTPVGDPIELQALADTLGARRTSYGLGPLYIGSIKPNVGHTEGCSGLAGILKSVACLERGKLVPTYGVENINPKLRLSEWNLALPKTTMRWPSHGQRRISVNSFGFGGANAHAIIDDAYHYLESRRLVGNHSTVTHDDESDSESGISVGPGTPLPGELPKRLFVFSSKYQGGMQRMTQSYAKALLSPEFAGQLEHRILEDLSYTLTSRRSHLDFNGFCVASTMKDLVAQLSEGLATIKKSHQKHSNLVFVFTGQGAQWPAMGVELLQNPVFEQSICNSQQYLADLGCAWRIVDELRKTVDSNINNPEYSQTLCTVLQVALVDLLRYWKVMARAVVGHSSGEIAAAYAASHISHADAIKIAYVRGIMSASVTRKGAMLAAGVSRDDAAQFLDEVPLDSANVACVNSPTSVTLSGDAESISKLEKLISGAGKFARKLKVTTAYHSSHMKAVAQGYLNKMGSVDTNPKSKNTGEQAVLMFSSLTGEFVNPEQLGAEYWVSNMCSPVEFSAAVTSLLSHVPQEPGVKRRSSPIRWDGLIEIGPHTALKGPVQQIITAAKNKAAKEAPYMAMILRGVDAIESSLSVAGNLWGIGHPIHLDAVHSGTERSSGFPLKCLSNLPTYPWNHARTFWHEAYSTKSNRQPKHARTDLLGAPEDMQNSFEPRWNNYLRISENPWIEDHQITGTILYPAAGMLVMALEGALRLSDKSRVLHGFRFNNVNFERGLVVPSDEEGAVKTTLSLLPAKEVPDQYRFTIFSTTVSASWTKHCHGTVALEYKQDAQSEIQSVGDDAEWSVLTQQYQRYTSTSTAEVVDVEDFYDHLQSIGMEYGPLFRNVVSLHALPSNKASHGIVIVPDTKQSMPEGFEFPHVMHPATMDAIFHLLLAAFNDGCPVDEAAVPYSIEDMFVAADQPQEVGSRFRGYGELVSKNNDGHEIVGDLTMSDELWSNPKLIVKRFALRQVTASNDSTVDNALLSTEKCASIKWSEDDRFSRTLQSATETGQDLSNTEDATFGLPSDVYLLVSSAPSAQITSLCSLLGDYYASSNVSLHRVTLSEIVSDNLIGKHVVSLMEVESALIYSWTEEEFAAFKSIISTVDHLLWITRGGLLDSFSAGAEFAPAQGLLRVLRNEYTLTTLPHLDLSLTFDYTNPDHCQRIFDVWKASLEKDAEMEYAESNGNIYVPRVVGEQALDEELQLSSGSPLPIQSRLGDSEIPLKLTIASRASKCLGTAFDFRDCLQSNEVEIQIEYVALDKSEASTSITASQGWGKEAAGTITQCGSQVNGFHVGQRVAVLGKELSKTKIRVDKNTVVAIPSALASQDAVTMVIASITAQYSLLEIASISERSTVLVNSAGSALGQAAIQICQAAGATTFALVVSKEEKDLLVDKYGISPTNIFDSSLRSFVAGIRMVTYGLGVDAVFNPEYNSATGLSTGLLNNFGYFLDLHARSASSTPTRLLSSTPNAVIVRIDMDSVIEARPKTIQALLQTIFSRSKHGQALTTIAPVKVFTAGQLPAAVEALRALQNGKIVLAMDSTAEILTMPPPASKLSLPSDATYVLAGGLGVLGLEIANLMAESGAKHLVFLTRSGGSNKEKDLEAFRARGVRAEAYKCDITDSRGVARIFQQLQAEGYVVKGVVQCAMVLEDTIFENMTYRKWLRAFLPKTRGSRNLLAQLWPANEPFFILLSSITGVIGNNAQSNYASGNTFEDALAHHARNHLGIHATSIDVGLVSDSSHFTSAGEFGDLHNYLHKYQHGWNGLQTTMEELRWALAAVMRGSTSNGCAIPAQFVLGLGNNLIRQPGSTGFERDRKFDLRVADGVQEMDTGGGAEESVGERLKDSTSLAEAAAAVEFSLRRQISASSGIPVDEVDAQRPLPEFGVDSLTAVELRNRTLKEMRSEISVFELLSSTPMADLAVKIASRSELVPKGILKMD